jgi:hypothetical protein
MSLALMVAAVVVFKLSFATYSYRYRLQFSLSIDGQVHTGSSVVEVAWECGPKITGLGQCGASLRGQAAAIDLGPRGVVIAALVNGENDVSARDGATNAIWLCADAFGGIKSNADLPKLRKLSGKRDLIAPNLPRFIWFKNPDDPTTATKLLAQDVPAAFGGATRFAGASVAITGDPIVIDINRKFPWFQSWSDNYPSRGPIYLPSGLALSRYMLVGDAS